MSLLKRILYSKIIKKIMTSFLGVFYDKKYLKGKFFDEKRMGFLWALKSLPRLGKLKRQNITWPVGKNTTVLNGHNIFFDPSSINIFQQHGCYYQAFSKIIIGKDVWIAQNVGIITANHDLKNPEKHSVGKDVLIGDRCWVGMNSVILPGVILGENTVVGAGSVVTKSFPEGHCVIVGNPATKLKDI